MNSAFRRILSLVLALTMIGSPLAVCAEGLTDEATEPEAAVVEETTEETTQPEETEVPTEPETVPEETEEPEEPEESASADKSLSYEVMATSGSCGRNLSWSLIDGTLTISYDKDVFGDGKMTDYTDESYVPWYSERESIRFVVIGEGVTSIGKDAFAGCRNLIDVSIPTSVETIGVDAFSNCRSLIGLTIPNGVKTIEGAFQSCTALRSLTIPESVTKLGGLAFSRCDSLTSMTIPKGITSIEYGLFKECSNLTSVTIQGRVDQIHAYAFASCRNLTTVTMPNGPTKIDIYAFDSCSKLTNFTIPDSVTSIETHAFAGCTSLLNMTIPNNVTTINYAAFYKCSGLTSVNFGSSVNTIGVSAFYGCSSLASVVIPDNVTQIGDAAFSGCSSLTSVKISKNLTSLSRSLFSGCSSLSSVTIPDRITAIGYGAFSSCKSLMSVTIPDGVTSIGEYAFNKCTSLPGITIPNSVTQIGEFAFYGCSSLEKVKIPRSVTTINKSTFDSCSKLTSVEIPNNVTTIGDYAFADCSSLPSITIPNSVTRLGVDAFRSCSSLPSVTIPNSVITIDNYAFYGCSGLTSVKISDCATIIGNYAFYNCSKLLSVSIPGSVRTFGNYAFSKCGSLTDVEIKNGVTGIGSNAFSECGKLTHVSMPNSVTSIGVSAFYRCKSLPEVIIPDGVTTIETATFGNCSSLAEVAIPVSVKLIGTDAFYDCSNLKDVYYAGTELEWNVIQIQNGNDCLKNAQIHYNSTLESGLDPNPNPDPDPDAADLHWTVESGVLTISGTGSTKTWGVPSSPEISPWYSRAEEIHKIVIEDGISDIATNLFIGCKNVTEVFVGKDVRKIESEPFASCMNLKKVEFTGDAPIFAQSVFSPISVISAYYPYGNETWSAVIGSKYGAQNIIWIPWIENLDLKGVPRSSNINVSYEHGFVDNTIAQTTLRYEDDFFSQKNTEYHQNIALISLGAAMSSVTIGKSEPGKLLSDGDQCIQRFMQSIGVDKSAVVTQKYNNNHDTSNTAAYAIGCKQLPDGKYLVPVFVRSFGYGPGFAGEWASNFDVWNDQNPEYSNGFKEAADYVHAGVKQYLENYMTDIPTSDIKFWVVGYSRGGAVANLLACTMHAFYPSSTIFAYTFATPSPVKRDEVRRYPHQNYIFNIVNEMDIVPRVPLREDDWSYSRFGTTLYLPCQTNTQKYADKLYEMERNFHELTPNSYNVGAAQEVTLDLLMDYVQDIASSSEKYSSFGLQKLIHDELARGDNEPLDILWITIETVDGTGTVANDIRTLMEYYKSQDIWALAKQVKVTIEALDKLAPVHNTARTLVRFLTEYSGGIVRSSLIGGIEKFFSSDGRCKADRYDAVVYMISQLYYSSDIINYTDLIMQHVPETYLAWLKTGTPLTTGHKIKSVKCPVDVIVKDETGAVVCRIVDDVVDESVTGLYAYVENGEKYIYMPDDGSYTTEIIAREDGEVSIVSTDYTIERDRQNTVGYVHVPMKAGQVFMADNNDNVTTNGKTLPKDLNYWGSQEVTMTILVEGSGFVAGDGSCNVGESASLAAVPGEGYEFLGWFDENDELISFDYTVSVLMLENRTVKAVFCEELDVDVEQSHLTLQPGETFALNAKIQPEKLARFVNWTVDHAEKDGKTVITVNSNGTVTAVNPGTAYAVVSIEVRGELYYARCRIDVVGGEEENPIASQISANGVDLIDPKATVELFRTDYAQVGVLLNFMQNMHAFSEDTVPADQGAAIERARFSDDALNVLFRLRVKDDRTLEIIPTEVAVSNPASVKASYKSAVKITVEGREFETAPLTLTVKKSLPTIKAAAVKINSFDGTSAAMTFTGGKVTALRPDGALPAGFRLDGMKVVYTGSQTKASAKLNLLAAVEGYAVEKAVTVPVSVTRTEPTVKLKPASVTLLAKTADKAQATVTVEEGRELELTLLDSTGKVTDALNYEYRNGIITVSPKANTPAGTYKLAVNAVGSSKKANLTIKVADKKASLSLKASGAIDTAIPGSPITITANISGFHVSSGESYHVTIMNGTKDATDLFRMYAVSNVLTLTAAGGIPKGTYTAKIGADLNNDGTVECEKSVKLNIKWSDPAKVKPSVTLKASGSIDPVKPGSSVTVKPTFKNLFGHSLSASDLVFFRNGVKLESAPFHVTVENGAYVITGRGADSSAKYTAAFSANSSLPESKQVSISVKTGTVKLEQSLKTVTLLKKDRYDSVIVHLDVPAGYNAIGKVEQDSTSAALYTVTDLGGGDYAISFAGHRAAAKAATVKLKVYLKGNLNDGAKPNATASIKVTPK